MSPAKPTILQPVASLLAFAILGLPFDAIAQTTSTLTVRLLAQDGSDVSNGTVGLKNRATGFEKELRADGTGLYSLANIPLQTYRLTAASPGFTTAIREVALRTNVPLTIDIKLQLSTVQEAVTVNAVDVADLVDTEATGTRTALSSAAMEKVPAALGSRGIETYLLTFPGFAMNANGAIHPRGAHNQMTFVIDGMPVNDQLTGAFSTALDANLVDSLELYTGDIPAEFGAKVSGVAAISTRSGAGSGRRFFGSTQMSGGQFDTLQNVIQVGGEHGKFAYYASIFEVKTHRFLDQVSLDNLHNGGDSQRGFLRLDYQASARDSLHLNVMSGRSSFELANLRSQQAAGMRQRQLMRDLSVWVRWNRILNPGSTWESTLAYRPAVAYLFPSPHDTPVTASQARHLTTITSANRYSRIAGAHNIRAGIDLQHFPVSENFFMGITDPNFNVPGEQRFNDGLLPYDLTRGGRLFLFSQKRSGTLYSGFVQDAVKWQRFVFSLGLRYDNYRFLVKGNQVQPRVGMAFHLKETGTVFRASYNRNFQTAPNENLLLSSSEEASRLAPESVRQALGQSYAPLRSQRENVYEAGIQQSLFRKASLNASFYHKASLDQQDNNNFFNTGIIFPVALAKIRVNGAEGRITLPNIHGFTATLSATHSRAVSTPPFTGGLFLGQEAIDLLSSGPFVIDHDQKLSLQTSVNYTSRRNWWASTSVRYDSGLVANPSNAQVVAADPDYRDLLPYVDLASSPARVTPRTITDVAAGYQFVIQDRRRWDVQVQISNLFNVTALYNFQSVFVGTRLVTPRSAGLKLRFYW
jgi:hypothetical protein